MAQFTDSSPVEAYNLSGNAFVDGLLQGSSAFRYAWSTVSGGKTQITYSLPFTDLATAQFVGGYGSESQGDTLFGLDANQASLLDLAFSKWEDVADLNFSKLTETEAGQVGDIRVAFSSDVNPWWGWAKLSSSGYNNAHGDIWISTDVASDDWHEGSYALNALVHEIGHALGLDHPFDGTIIPDGYDNRRYTLMSYTDPDTIWWWNPDTQRSDYLISGPMVYDIQAIQYLYGANMEFHAGNDTYSFATDIPFYKAIWDAGGKDTIDLSNFTKGNTLNLEPGSYSTLGFDNLDLTDNLGIAFGAFIENAKGGSGDDRITGNLRANILYGNDGADQLYGMSGRDVLLGGNGADRLFGGSGSDTLIGGGGDDALAGGVGNDTAKYLDASAGVMVDLQAGTASSRSAGDAAGIGNDTLAAIEYAKGSNFDDILTGDGLANRLWGFDGNDELSGGGRSDLLDGGKGNDSMQGGGGHDVLIGGAGDDLLDGGVGRDKANYKTASDGVVVNLSTGKAVSAVAGDAALIGSDTLVAIENVNGSAYADRLTGDA